jgi:recombinational DNA repair protein (RecF pathway)
MDKMIEYEVCVGCGEVTNVPKNLIVQKREFYIEGAGQLCEKCGRRLKQENEPKRKNDLGV